MPVDVLVLVERTRAARAPKRVTVMCQFPGARSTRPGRMASPFSASFTAHLAAAVQPLGERLREHRRHVLHHHHAHRAGRPAASSARSSAPPGLPWRSRWPPARTRRGPRSRGGRAAARPGSPGRRPRAGRSRGRSRRPAGPCTTMRAALFTFSTSSRAIAGMPPERELEGFSTKSTAPSSSACSVRSAPLGRVGAQHDDGRRPQRHDPADGLQPAHAGHLHVQRDDVGLLPRELLQRELSLRRGGHHRDLGVGAEDVRGDLAHQRRIVDYHDPDHGVPSFLRR